MFDTKKEGKIDKTELKIVLKALGFEIKKQELDQLVSQYDIDETG